MKWKFPVIIFGLITTMLLLIIASSSEASHPHYQLSQLKSLTNKQKYNRYMTIYGNVKEGSIIKKGVTAQFSIIQEGVEIPVYFTGKTLLPDTFKDGAQAGVDGRFKPQDNIFIADKVMAKCASKYQAPVNGQKKIIKI